eukprot:179341_1
MELLKHYDRYILARLLQSKTSFHFFVSSLEKEDYLVSNLINNHCTLDILAVCVSHGDFWYFVEQFQTCGFWNGMISLLEDVYASTSSKQKAIQIISKFTYWERMHEEKCSIVSYPILEHLVSFCYEGGDILKWCLNAILNIISTDLCHRYDSPSPHHILAQIIPVLKWCLATQQWLKYCLNIIDILLVIGDKSGDGHNVFARFLSINGVERLLRALDGNVWNMIYQEEEIFQFAYHTEYRQFINDFERWRDRVLYEYFGSFLENKEMLLVSGYVRLQDMYIILDIIGCIVQHIPKRRAFRHVSSHWTLSHNKNTVTLIRDIQETGHTQLVYLNDNGYDSGIHFLAIKSRRYPYNEDSCIGIVSKRNLKWVDNANELFPNDMWNVRSHSNLSFFLNQNKMIKEQLSILRNTR